MQSSIVLPVTEFQSLKGIRGHWDRRNKILHRVDDGFQSLKGIRGHWDAEAIILATDLQRFQSLKGIRGHWDEQPEGDQDSLLDVSIPERD